MLLPLAIVEGISVDYNLHFKVTHGKFVQTYEGTRNGMTPRTADAIALGPNGNVEGGIQCFSLTTGRMLQRQWKDVEVYKMPISAISRINCMCKRQKAAKGLKFGDRQNLINDAIRAGVEDTALNPEHLHNIPNPRANINAIHHDILVDEGDSGANNEMDDDDDLDSSGQIDGDADDVNEVSKA